MKRFCQAGFTLAVTMLLLGVVFAQQNAELDEVRQQWQERYNQGDAQGVADLYTEDAALYDADGSVYQGRDSIQETLQQQIELGFTQVDIASIETEVLNGTAYEIGSYTVTSEEGMASEGYYLVISQRENGTWRIHRHFANMVLPEEMLAAMMGQTMAPEQMGEGETFRLTFTKEDPDGDATWDGTVSGDAEGTVQTILLSADQSEAVWRVAFEGIITADEQSFRAHVGGTLDTNTGAVRMTGVVTEGHMLGAAVSWLGQMVDAEASRFTGSITLTPPQATTGTAAQRYLVHVTWRQEPTEEILALMPAEEARAAELMAEGLLANLYMAADGSQAWAVWQVESEDVLQENLRTLPLYDYLDFTVIPLSY